MSARRSSSSSDATTATKLAALQRKQTPVPTVAIRMPATAGPIARATLTSTELRLTALRRCSGPTISSMNDWRAGFSNALLRPSKAASTAISHTRTLPDTVRTPSTSACTPIRLCRQTISRRLSTRSAITPPYGASRSTGSVCAATMRPRAVLECVSVSTSQDCAVICIHVPTSEIDCPEM